MDAEDLALSFGNMGLQNRRKANRKAKPSMADLLADLMTGLEMKEKPVRTAKSRAMKRLKVTETIIPSTHAPKPKSKKNIRVAEPIPVVAKPPAPPVAAPAPVATTLDTFPALMDGIVRAQSVEGIQDAYREAVATQEALISDLKAQLPKEEEKLQWIANSFTQRLAELTSEQGAQEGGAKKSANPKPRPDDVTLIGYKIRVVGNIGRLRQLYAEGVEKQTVVIDRLKERILMEEGRLAELDRAYQQRVRELELVEQLSAAGIYGGRTKNDRKRGVAGRKKKDDESCDCGIRG